MRDVYLAGTGMTHFGKYHNSNIRTLAEESVREALSDANATPDDIQAVFFSNAAAGMLTGQEMIRGQVALRYTGLLGKPIINVENACASGSSAFHAAYLAVASGAYDNVLVVGCEKLTHEDKNKSFAALGAAVDLIVLGDFIKQLSKPTEEKTGNNSEKTNSSKGHSPFMDIYALAAKHYMSESGATKEDFALVSVKNHYHGSLNPKAQYQETFTLEEVLNSRLISEPLTLLMCAPIGDGSASIVLSSQEWIKSKGLAPIKVRSSVIVSGMDRDLNQPSATTRAAQIAYEKSSVSPEDLDVIEVHDAAAPAELIVYEEIGLCPKGDGPKLLRAKETYLGGRVPVNTSGGLLSKGHPIGATGCGQIVELADQLRQRCGARQVDNPKVALSENGGGFLGLDPAAVAITILSI